MIHLSNNLKRLTKAGAILFGLIFIVAGVIGIHQDNTFLPTKGVIQLSNSLKRLMKAGAILFGLTFIVAGVAGIHQDNTFLPTKGVIRSMERTYVATDSNDTDTWEVMVEYTVDGKNYISDLGQKKDDFTVGKEIDILYNPSNPEAIVLPGKTVWIIAIIAGAIVAIAAAVLLVRDMRNR